MCSRRRKRGEDAALGPLEDHPPGRIAFHIMSHDQFPPAIAQALHPIRDLRLSWIGRSQLFLVSPLFLLARKVGLIGPRITIAPSPLELCPLVFILLSAV